MLIPAKGNYEVCYKGINHEGKEYTWAGPRVEAWDEEGTPWIVTEDRRRRLVPADIHSNYSHVREADGPIVAVIPGGDWQYECEGWDGPGPVLAWLVQEDGCMYPVDTDGDGMVDKITQLSNLVRIFHPSWLNQSSVPPGRIDDKGE